MYTNLCIKFFQFFPEASEVKFARQSAFGGASFKLDYLTKPSFFEDFGFFERVKMADRVKLEDELFLVAYPYFNVNGSFKYPIFFVSPHKFYVLLFITYQKKKFYVLFLHFRNACGRRALQRSC